MDYHPVCGRALRFWCRAVRGHPASALARDPLRRVAGLELEREDRPHNQLYDPHRFRRHGWLWWVGLGGRAGSASRDDFAGSGSRLGSSFPSGSGGIAWNRNSLRPGGPGRPALAGLGAGGGEARLEVGCEGRWWRPRRCGSIFSNCEIGTESNQPARCLAAMIRTGCSS